VNSIETTTDPVTLRRKLARSRYRMDQLREMIAEQPTHRGECDDCHLPGQLRTDPDEPEAGWQYCVACIRHRQDVTARRIQLLQRRLRDLHEPEELRAHEVPMLPGYEGG